MTTARDDSARSHRIQIMVSDTLYQRLADVAAATGVSKETFFKNAVRSRLAQITSQCGKTCKCLDKKTRRRSRKRQPVRPARRPKLSGPGRQPG